MKKVFKLSLGAVGIITPIASTVSCAILDGIKKAKKINDAMALEVKKISNGTSGLKLKDENNKVLIKDWLKKQDSYTKGDKDYKKAVDTLDIIKITKENMKEEFIKAHLTKKAPTKDEEKEETELSPKGIKWSKAVTDNPTKLFLLFKINAEDSFTYIFTEQGINITK